MMSFRPKRILYRIIIPYTVLFILMSCSTWLLSAYFITIYLDQGLEKQMEQVASVISKSRYVLNPVILKQLRDIINAEIVLFSDDGRIISTTVADTSLNQQLQKAMKAARDKPYGGMDTLIGGRHYRTIIHPIMFPEHGRTFLGLLMPTSNVNVFYRTIFLSMGLITLVGIVAMVGIGYTIARTITAPVEELVRVAEKVSGGNLNQKVYIKSKDEIGSLAVAFNDMIGQLKDFEEKLIDSEKMATAGQLAAGMAHEVRNPLTSIKMMVQVLAARLQTQPQTSEILAALIREIDRLDRIIAEIISKTRPGELQKKAGNVNQLLKEVISIALENFSNQGIFIEEQFERDLPELCIDQEKIKQVLWNLILNAKEAMSKGGIIKITTSKSDSMFVEISIIDTGPGITTDDVERLFQPFFTTKPEGVGLGLTMSRKIIEKHGGTMTLNGMPGGGAHARVFLPVGL